MQAFQHSTKHFFFLCAFLSILTFSFGAPTGTLQVSKSSFYFANHLGDPNPPYQVLNITNAGTQSFNWLLKNADGSTFNPPSWFTATPTTGSLMGSFTANVALMVDTGGLPIGSYEYGFKIQDAANPNNTQTVSVHFSKYGPILTVSKNEIAFGTHDAGTNPEPQTLTVSNSGLDTVYWTITDPAELPSWLTIAPLSGIAKTNPNTITLSVSSAGLTEGAHSCTFEISDPGAAQSPQRVTVFLFIGSVIHVPADCASLPQAVNAIPEGGTVIVSPGTYSGYVFLDGTDFTLRSIDPEAPETVATTVIGDIVFNGSETPDFLLSGVTAASITGHNTQASIERCRIQNGDGISNCDGAISNCIVQQCDGALGGGLEGCDGLIDHCTITGNSAYYGGGLYNCNGTISNCLISGNYAQAYHQTGGLSPAWEGDEVAALDDWYQSRGGGLYGCDGTIVNCTIVNNKVLVPLDLYGNILSDTDAYGGGLDACNGTISNCIIWGNQAHYGAQLYNCSTPVYSCIMDWTGGGTGNISSDPFFVYNGTWDDNDTPLKGADDLFTAGDYHLQSEFGRWQPQQQLLNDNGTPADPNDDFWYTTPVEWAYDAVSSPCIDAGDPVSAWQNELWPHGARVNMGAYGGTAEASMSSNLVGNVADLDHDSFVNYSDFCLLSEDWLYTEWLLAADLDRDGTVGFADLTIFADQWLQQ